MKNTSVFFVLLAMAFGAFLGGCGDGNPPPAPQRGGAQDAMGQGHGPTAPHKVTILPLRNGG